MTGPARLEVFIQVRKNPQKESDGQVSQGSALVSQTSALGVSPCPISPLILSCAFYSNKSLLLEET